MKLKFRQRGATLFVALIMLVVMTIIAISAIRGSSTNLRIAGNMQMAGEATAAARQAIEQVVSSNFTTAPAASVISVDINGNGVADYQANIEKPACTGSVPLKNSDLDPGNPDDQKCIMSSAVQQSGIFFAANPNAGSGQSWCLAQKWDVKAQATSVGGGGANVTIHQGVSLRVPASIGC